MKSREQIVDQYCACLREKIQRLEEFKQATLKMKEAAASKDIQRIVRHVKEREGLIDRTEQIDRVLNKFKQGDSLCVERLSHHSKDLARRCLEKLKTALESLAVMDKECLDLALAHHDSMKFKILKVQHSLRAARGYRLAIEPHPRFLDVKR
jgi:methionine synthase II (cobalamin-independent)